MTPGKRQYDISIIIAIKRGRDVTILWERCDDTNTGIIVAREDKRKGRRDEKAGQRWRKGREEGSDEKRAW